MDCWVGVLNFKSGETLGENSVRFAVGSGILRVGGCFRAIS